MDLNGKGPVSAGEYRRQTRPVITLKSGRMVRLKPPGPEVSIKAQRMPAHLRAAMQEKAQLRDGETVEAMGLRLMREMTDEEFTAFMLRARDMVAAVCVEPKLVVGATGEDELDPSELEEADFWEIFNWATVERFVPVGDGEVKSSELASFRPVGGVQESVHHPEPHEGEPEPVLESA